MKKLFYFFAAATIVLAASCNKEKEDVQYAENPLKSISVTSGEETVAGVVNDLDKTVTFTFNNAENFSNVNLAVELNDGWTLTYPTTLQGVDLQSTPALRFTDPKNAIVRYTVAFSSNAFPIIDASKIQVKGLNAGEALTVDNTTKTISIKFDESKMDFNSIELIFNEGALQEGVKLPESLVFDFAQGNEHSLVLELGGDRVYTVKLDVTSYVTTTPEQMGFIDVSSNFVNSDQPYIKVYSANKLTGIPIAVTNESKYDPYWTYGNYNQFYYGGANPREWECNVTPDHTDPTFSDDIFSFPGDWKDDRATMDGFGQIAIVVVDAGKVKADLKAANGGIDPKSVNSAIVTSGWIHNVTTDYMVKDNGAFINLPTEEGHVIPYRSSILVNNGVVSFATAAEKSGKLYSVPFQTEKPDVAALVAASTDEISAADAAWVAAWGVRTGKKMRISDFVNNDASQYVSDNSVLGMGWSSNFTYVHNLVGTTYDGKLAFMINAAGMSNWDGIEGYVGVDNNNIIYTNGSFNFYGYSLKQMLWLAHKLGWRDAAALGNSYNEVVNPLTFTPSLLVNGKSVIDGAAVTNTTYVIAVDAK